MKGYKGFNKGLICRGKQYAENTVFEEDVAVICQKGMHFCVDPLEVLNYYPMFNKKGEENEFAEVEALDEPITDDGKKYASTKLKIIKKISIDELFAAATKQMIKSGEAADSNNEDSAKIGSSGYYAQIGSSGYSAQIGSSGDYAKIGSSGDSAQIISSGKNAVICCAGQACAVKGKKGSWITLAEWEWRNEEYVPVCVKTRKIDGVKIKEDTFYILKNGRFTVVSNVQKP